MKRGGALFEPSPERGFIAGLRIGDRFQQCCIGGAIASSLFLELQRLQGQVRAC
jgi:hypothetical protein